MARTTLCPGPKSSVRSRSLLYRRSQTTTSFVDPPYFGSDVASDRFEDVWKLFGEVVRIRMSEASYTHHLDVMAPRRNRINHQVWLPDDWIFVAQDHGYTQAAGGWFEMLLASQERCNHHHASRLEDVAPQCRL